MKLINALPVTNTLIHSDFHTGNVFMQKGEPLLIDMDRLSCGHLMIELADRYYFYVVLGEDDPSVVEDFVGFSCQTALKFFDAFLKAYMGICRGKGKGIAYILCAHDTKDTQENDTF